MPPSGVGATSVVNDPRASAVAFASDPEAFFDQTERNEYTALEFPAPGSGSTARKTLPQSGMLSMLTVMFEGTLDVTMGTSGTITTAGRWPYGLISQLLLSANAQNDLISVNGDDLHALRAIRHAGFMAQDTVDTYPGAIGPGNDISADAAVVLTWEVPVAIDPVSLVGAIYAQSPAMNLGLTIRQAVDADILVAAGTATFALTGTFYVMVTSFDIPIVGGEQGARLLVPDVSRLHGLQGFSGPITATGETRASLIRSNGALDRLLFQIQADTPDASATDYWQLLTADADEIDGVRIEYGAANRPLDYNPGHFLAQRNLNDYGDELPQAYYAFDFLTENPARDVVMLQGVTELVMVPTINSAVTIGSGAAWRMVQETLFA